MPIPFHFDRCLHFVDVNLYAPIERLKESGTYLYHGGYTQVVADVIKLVKLIEKYPTKFGLIGADFKIHLLGYSLGGVAAIGAASELENKFDSLSILFSTWNIFEINPQSIEDMFGRSFNFGSNEWKKTIKELKKNKLVCSNILKELIWGEGESIEFKNCAKRVLFIHGIKDEIFTREITDQRNEALISLQDCTFINLPSSHIARLIRRLFADTAC